MITLRPYQEVGKKEIYKAWRDGVKSILYQLVTGGGKSVLFTSIILDAIKANKRVMFLVHREELINQAWHHLNSVGIYSGIIKGGEPEHLGLQCQVASIQTVQRRTNLPEVDLFVIDEAHHAQIDNGYGHVLSQFPGARIVGVTATSYRLSGDGFGGVFEVLIQAKMPDGTPVDYKYLQNEGFLAQFKYYNVGGYDDSLLKKSNGDYTLESAAKAVELAPIVESYFQYCEGKCGIVFACDVAHSLDLERKYKLEGVNAIHIDANTPKTDREKAIEKLKNKEIQALLNVGIATEGFDAPNIDFVQLTRKTMSMSLFLQMIGRAGRIDNNVIKGLSSSQERLEAISNSAKTHGIILDNCGCFNEHVEAGEYAMGWTSYDWSNDFYGRKKKKSKPVTDTIEIIEYVAEDEEGKRVATKDIKEIEGLELVEVKRSVAQKIVRNNSVKEFERLFSLGKKLRNVKKVGFFAFFKYKEYCFKQNILMSDEIWQYLQNKLIQEKNDQIKKALEYQKTMQNELKKHYSGTELIKEYESLSKMTNDKVDRIKLLGVPNGFLKKQRMEIESKKVA